MATAKAVLKVAHSCYKKKLGSKNVKEGSQEDNPQHFILKVTGMQEYLDGEHQIIEYDYIRKSIGMKVQIELSLVSRQSIIDYLNELHAGYHSLVDDVSRLV